MGNACSHAQVLWASRSPQELVYGPNGRVAHVSAQKMAHCIDFRLERQHWKILSGDHLGSFLPLPAPHLSKIPNRFLWEKKKKENLTQLTEKKKRKNRAKERAISPIKIPNLPNPNTQKPINNVFHLQRRRNCSFLRLPRRCRRPCLLLYALLNFSFWFPRKQTLKLKLAE